MAFDFGMTLDFGVGVVDEGVVAIREFDGSFLSMSLPVATINPFPPFSRMTKTAPFG